MFNTKSTNADIAKHDWAQRDRAAMLRTLHAGRLPLTPAAVSGGCGTNVARNDPRSVQAYLAGKGDLRTTSWNLYCAVYMAVVSSATLEQAMYSFHQVHHWLTLNKFGIVRSLALTSADVERESVFNAAHNSIVREMRR